MDSAEVLNVVTCPDLPSALRAKSKAFRSYHYNDLGGQIDVPATMDFDDWDDVDRLRNGNPGPYLPVHISVVHTIDQAPNPASTDTSSATARPAAGL